MPKRYIAALIAIALLFFLGIWLLISLVTRDSAPETTEQTQSSQRAPELTKDANTIIYSEFGPVVGDEERRGIRIIITANERRVEELKGYYETVGNSQTVGNNQAAFNALLEALDGAGFDNYDARNKDVVQGTVCPTGRQYTFEARYSGDENFYSWTSSCGRKTGTFIGNRSTITTLMQNQIPDYDKFASNIDL